MDEEDSGERGALAPCEAGAAPRRVAAAAAARFLISLVFSVTATAASSKAGATIGSFSAEINVVVATGYERFGVHLHTREGEGFAFPGLHIGASGE